jgi:predicted lipoprotein with Yx(FWY)xxD motif
MPAWKRTATACALLAVTAAFATACGGMGTSATSTHSSSSIATSKSSVGTILVDSNGDTLYLFAKDSGGTSACSGACAKAWPPYAVKGTAPSAGPGLEASLLKSLKRADGTRQLSYDGHPLYTFSGDSKAGDLSGQDSDAFGAHWYVVSPQGSAITKAASSGAKGAY